MKIQKKIIVLVVSVFALIYSTSTVFSAKAGLTFLPNSDPLLFNYTIYYGTSSSDYTFEIDLQSPEVVDGAITTTVDNLDPGLTYYFAVASYNQYDESALSNEMAYTVPLPSPPVAHDISNDGVEDEQTSGTLLADNPDSNQLLFQITGQPLNGSVSLDETVGTFTYTPVPDFHGGDSFTYIASNEGGNSNEATVTLTISSVNDTPVATNMAFDVNEDTVLSSQLEASDNDGEPLTFEVVNSPAQGSVNLNSDGSFTYNPAPGISGTDSFTYLVRDAVSSSNTAKASITIQAVNHAPVASGGGFSTEQNSPYTGQLSASDEDGDTLAYTMVSAPQQGSVSLEADGSFTYTPSVDATGSDRFTFIASDGTLDSNIAAIDIIINEVSQQQAFEIGEVNVTSDWLYVGFNTPINNPAIVAKAGTTNDTEPGTVRIRNLSSEGFEVRLQEWDYLDGIHQAETVYYTAIEQGSHEMNEQFSINAKCLDIYNVDSFNKITYQTAFDSQPVVLASVVTNNDPDAATLRIRNVTSTDFELALQEEENNDGYHGTETVCYIALEQWQGITGDIAVEVASTGNVLTDASTSVVFGQQFPESPLTLAGMQNANGMNTAVLGMSDLSVEGVNMTIVEEQSGDTELNHIPETGGYFAITPFIPEDDNDADGLTNEQELTLKTHPGLGDTDKDGFDDGEEFLYWMDSIHSPDDDIDGDGLKNILDADSDGDGTFDGTEIQAGTDPADISSFPNTITMEVGEVSINHEPTRVNFANFYNQPVIIANGVTRNGSDPNVVRISGIDSNGFTIQLQEYDYLDTSHTMETVTFLVIEGGSYTLDDGTEIEAGTFDTASTNFTGKTFANEFTTTPVLLTTVLSWNESDTIAIRLRNITTTGFDFKLQEQEANPAQHSTETLGYLAWTPGSGSSNSIQYVAGTTPDKVSHKNYSVNWTDSFSQLPFHFAGMQTTDGGDTAAVKITGAWQNSMDISVEEESSNDQETRHTNEVAGYLIVLPY